MSGKFVWKWGRLSSIRDSCHLADKIGRKCEKEKNNWLKRLITVSIGSPSWKRGGLSWNVTELASHYHHLFIHSDSALCDNQRQWYFKWIFQKPTQRAINELDGAGSSRTRLARRLCVGCTCLAICRKYSFPRICAFRSSTILYPLTMTNTYDFSVVHWQKSQFSPYFHCLCRGVSCRRRINHQFCVVFCWHTN